MTLMPMGYGCGREPPFQADELPLLRVEGRSRVRSRVLAVDECDSNSTPLEQSNMQPGVTMFVCCHS